MSSKGINTRQSKYTTHVFEEILEELGLRIASGTYADENTKDKGD
jgi:hypothetical protein